jgi:hypothetical protein
LVNIAKAIAKLNTIIFFIYLLFKTIQALEV